MNLDEMLRLQGMERCFKQVGTCLKHRSIPCRRNISSKFIRLALLLIQYLSPWNCLGQMNITDDARLPFLSYCNSIPRARVYRFSSFPRTSTCSVWLKVYQMIGQAFHHLPKPPKVNAPSFVRSAFAHAQDACHAIESTSASPEERSTGTLSVKP